MATRKLNITIELIDNDTVQWNLENLLNEVVGAENITSTIVLPNTDELYKRDDNFKKLLKLQKEAKDAVRDYINKYNR